MASLHAAVVFSLMILCFGLGAVAQGKNFPFYDNCRRNPKYSKRQLVALKPTTGSDGVVSFCFQIKMKKSCTPEMFSMKGQRIQARCCNTTFAKIKFYVDPVCRPQFQASDLIVPNMKEMQRQVSPTWDRREVNYTEVKYTQFGPIPQSQVGNTKFCLRMKPGTCSLKDFTGFTNPYNRKRKVLQVAIYDRKKDGYECCPTFTFPASF